MTILLIEYMDSKYRELLRMARGKTPNIHPLMSTGWFYKSMNLLAKSSTPDTQSTNIAQVAKVEGKESNKSQEVNTKANEVTERIKILDSLNVFGNEKLESESTFKFKGGELRKKTESAKNELLFDCMELHSILTALSQSLPEPNYRIKSSLLESLKDKEIKVMFITDAYKKLAVDSDVNPIELYFDPNVSELFSKMITAMKLDENNSHISALGFGDKEDKDLILSEIYHAKPKLIMTLGATSTNFLTGNTQRLKDTHGELRDAKLRPTMGELFNCKLMPLFSPSLLLTAPNMKKTAWTDMQKAMEYLNL